MIQADEMMYMVKNGTRDIAEIAQRGVVSRNVSDAPECTGFVVPMSNTVQTTTNIDTGKMASSQTCLFVLQYPVTLFSR